MLIIAKNLISKMQFIKKLTKYRSMKYILLNL